mgnify:CR=1 FL=1
MIFWFSGTGNSKYVANKLSILLNDRLENIAQYNEECKLADFEKLIFIFPIYSWGIPPIVSKFIDSLNIKNFRNNYISMICTCGDEVAKAPEMFLKLMKKKNLNVNSIFSVTMPNNYVLLPGFDVDTEEVERNKIEKVDQRIEHISKLLNQNIEIIDVVRGSIPTIKTTLIYPLFKKWGIFPSKWFSTNKCLSCGLCKNNCPIGNITVDAKGKPIWGKNCISCLACFHICPTNAVQYGKLTKGKGQYFFKVKK